jgi:hypothetical protein
MRSPLQTKASKALNELKKLFPKNSKISSFFLHDGVLEVGLASSNRLLVAHTNKYSIYEFWSILKDHPALISSMTEFVNKRISIPELYLLQDNWHERKDAWERSCFFFMLSKYSDSGYASHGNLDKKRLSALHINKIKNFKCEDLYILFDQCDDPTDTFVTAKDTDFILLPIGDFSYNLFDQGKNIGPDMYLFNHNKIKEKIITTDKKWVIVYKSHPAVYKLYADYNIIMIDKYGNKTQKKENCSELIINNFVFS